MPANQVSIKTENEPLLQSVVQSLKKNWVKVVSAKESLSEGPEGSILESMLEGMAEYYSAELAQKVNRGLKENALKGKNNGGSIPLGYMLGEGQKLKIDPLTAPVVREIYQRYDSDETIKEIIASLNERHILTWKKRPFSQAASISFCAIANI